MVTSSQARSAFALGVLALLTCGDGKRSATMPPPARPRQATLRLAFMTDLDGYLEPCGCQSRPLGGVDRAATKLKELSADGVPTLLMTAGDLLFAPESETDPKLDGGDAEVKLQRQWQAETLTKVLLQLGLFAAVPGAADTGFGAAKSGAPAASSGIPLLGIDRTDGEPASPASQSLVVMRAALRIGVFGLSQLGMPLDAVHAPDLPKEAQRLTQGLRTRGADLVVGLVSADARTARKIAGSTRGLDFLLHGGGDSSDVPPPEQIGETTLLRAGRQGRGLLVVDLFSVGKAGAFTDASAWTQEVRKQALEQRVAELAARVREWKRDSKVDKGELAQQEARLKGLRAELAAPAMSAGQSAGNAFSARFIELDKQTPGDADTRALLDAHNKRVNEHARTALAHVLPKPVKKGEPAYVGSARCGDCHEAAFSWWQGHAHGSAYATLERRNAEFNLSCVGCHVTGYNQPGGSTVVHVERLTNVGCESCHGPGSLHAANPDVDDAKNVRREVPEVTCKHCHNSEHSDQFEYARYREKLIVKGHGLPAEQAH